MNIEELNITYNVDSLYDATIAIFDDALKDSGVDTFLLTDQPTLFSFYEKNISYPIDDLKDNVNIEREDFYETILIMSWAIYREWVKCVIEKNFSANDLKYIDKNKVIELFLDNLKCEEGMGLYEKVMAASKAR